MSKRAIASRVIAGVTAVALLFLASNQSTAAAKGADELVRTIGQRAIESLTGKDLTDAQRRARFRAMLDRNFDVTTIARFCLGRYWRQTDEAQRKEYVGLFEDFIVQAYAERFKAYSGEVFTVGKVHEVNDRDTLVQSELVLHDGRKIDIYWRVRGNNDLKIIDVIVEGVSMAITHRDEFAALISQNGGKVDGLLAALRKKTGK